MADLCGLSECRCLVSEYVKNGLLWQAVSLFLGLVINLIDGVNRHKGFGICLFHIVHQSTVFLLIYDHIDFPAGGLIVGTDHIVETAAGKSM